ncbi:MAG TPA: alpha/beta hydrolase [Thermomicrobiales bacterium]|nr:alpha/beta hydrolase [Thermomicrobiales bacterium]
MAEWSEDDLAIGGIPIHYYRLGRAGGPPVVLLHGFSDAGLCWLRLARDLAPDYDVVMFDAAGHGRSGGPEHGFRERAVGDVLAAIDGLGLTRPALVGHSMGAATAAGVAAEASERLRGVALEDPPWRDGPPPAPVASPTATGIRAPLRSPEWVAWLRSLKTMPPEERYAMAATERPGWAEVDRVHWADAKARFNLAVVDQPPDAGRPPWREVAGRIRCPVLLITADPARGAIVTPEAAAEAARLWPNARVVQIPGAGHNIRRDQYEPYRAAVTDFLGGLAGG